MMGAESVSLQHMAFLLRRKANGKACMDITAI
jgi:hypothetical protein